MYGAEIAKGMSASAGEQRAYRDEIEDRGVRVSRQMATVPGLIAQAAETGNYAADRTMSLDAFASRAVEIATRLTGSFPTPGPDRNPLSSEKSAEPASALDALQQTIGNIRRPLSAMDEPFGRLAAALDAIDRALS